ncbi:MAG: hypothetical protein H7070_01155, partial [Saprospiraceae bacterium]|nr:hypothetical protein [Pyrinomonadaceae bacterium]
MDEIIEPTAAGIPPEQSAKAAVKAKSGWREYLETEDATRFVYLVFAFAAIVMVLSFTQFQTSAVCCGDWDGYYHIKTSMLMWENLSQGKWLPTFEWLPLTVLNPQHYNDHHFLFHLLQIPFLWFFEPVTAAKVAAVTFASLAVFSVYWLLHRYKVDYPLIWLAAIFTCANMFYYRMNMAKAPPLTIIITIAGIYLLFERKYKWLLPLMFAFVWTYSLFPLLLFAAVIWAIIIAWNEQKFEWEPLAYTFGGMILGNIINPYFPNNLYLFWEHAYTKIKLGSDFAVAVGGEWYPYTGLELLTHFPVAMAAMLIGYILFIPKGSKLPEKATFFLMFASILLAAQFRSKRFAEYFPPFSILFAAFSWQAFMQKDKVELPEDFKREIEPYLDVDRKTEKQAMWSSVKQAGVWTLGIVLIAYFFINMIGLQKIGIDQGGLLGTLRDNEVNDKYQRSMEWAKGVDADGKENIPAGEIIFNTNWDDFPKLFFFNTKHRYVYGLDPNYLFSQNPELYKTLLDITSGKTDDAGPIIREKFGSNHVFADSKENDDMIAKLLESGWADMVYEDDEARILRIRTTKGEPAKDAVEEAPETEEEKKLLDEEEKAGNLEPNTNAVVEEG